MTTAARPMTMAPRPMLISELPWYWASSAPERPTRPLEIIKPRTFMRLVEMPWARAMCSLLPVARMAQPSWVPKNQYSSATMAMTKMPLTKMAAGTLALESSSWYWVRLTVRLLLPPMMCILME